MVVCNTPLMQLPTACSITALPPYLSGLCQLSAMPTIACNQRYPQLYSGPLIAASAPIACPPPLSQSAARLRRTPPLPSPNLPLTPPDSPQGSLSPTTTLCNGVNLVPCTVSVTNGLTSIVPIPPVPFPPKATTNASTNSAAVTTSQCTAGVYTSTPITSPGLLQCSPRVVNGRSVLQCIPGLCPVTPAMLPTAPLEVIPSAPIVSSTSVYPLTPPPSLSSNLCASSAISAWKQSYGMEQVWQFEFKSLFAQYSPHNWMLFPVIDKPEGIWNSNVDSAKVRFCCEDCGHGWTSMKGRVAFWFVLNRATGEGVVCLKLYGQQCDRCKNGTYEPAMWYPEEVLKVMVNIYNRVGQVYYGFQQAPYHRARRAGKPRTPHNSELCQACKDGVCSERR